ncbi:MULTISPECIES: citrate synthase [unclassified Methylobacter]|jgi:citrate synthase|uniref:citrate synthase n=1 Tax=unclassified Methylobacter TaxID=2635283 RepID=UPI00189507C7|nr:citrate synthase [Methylobacter sp. BlB1]MBF6647241.1 citrate synthase [Methylobacter sp. BlB1]
MTDRLKPLTPAILTLDDKTYTLPTYIGIEGEKAIDISKLRSQTGYVTLDEGYGNTGACESAITYIDGEKGILRYRGYPIEELAEHSRFVEVAYLLLYGELPTVEQLQHFSTALNDSSIIHEDMHHFFNGFPRGSHPMGILATMVASLSTFYPVFDRLDEASEIQIVANLVSQVRTIAAFSYKKSIGEPLVYPSHTLSYVRNFLNMMFASPVRDYQLDDDIVRAIDMLLILHADHEQNCSTSSVRTAGSSMANVYAVISAGISALWGPRHGGANQEVIKMLEQIHAEGGDGTEFINEAKNKYSSKRLMGFGHRVYKNYDPRATVLKKHCDVLLNKPGIKDPLLDIARRIEEVALNDDYFISRKLYPNVDFYSGLILRAAGIPTNMFTVLFAIGRMPGWLAHWREMIHGERVAIYRPRQIYVGESIRHYRDIKDRT